MIKFTTTKKEMAIIKQIVVRAMKYAEEIGSNYAAMDCDMDITACHCNGNKLNLQKLLEADKFNFCHDVFGIRGHINRETGKLGNCFVPRCSATSAKLDCLTIS